MLTRLRSCWRQRAKEKLRQEKKSDGKNDQTTQTLEALRRHGSVTEPMCQTLELRKSAEGKAYINEFHNSLTTAQEDTGSPRSHSHIKDCLQHLHTDQTPREGTCTRKNLGPEDHTK
ncbi:hypothetical protein NDU88_005526 [Pleurodeles waltl]|uniref:Uncharacterized protein n=1 Tax=Pleurodeles waltl TaxID=8319 RepID=A0AAV7L4A4_PLEWA|nr:hypothetical protein NDU88_005526 [Pleurodeles waltl]